MGLLIGINMIVGGASLLAMGACPLGKPCLDGSIAVSAQAMYIILKCAKASSSVKLFQDYNETC